MEFKIFHSRNDFPAALLHLLKDAPLFLQPDYLEALEKGGPDGLSFRYVAIVEKGKYIAFYNYHMVSLSNRSIHRIFYNQQYSKLLSRFSAMMTRYIFGVKEGHPHYLLINGSVMISGPYYGWAHKGNQDLVLSHLNNALGFLTKQIEQDCKIIATVIKDFDRSGKFKPASGFNKVMMDPVMELSLRPEWVSMDSYGASLSAKYRQRYNNSSKKIKGFESRYLSMEEIHDQKEVINQLYQNVQQRSPIRLVSPDAGYLEAVQSMRHPDAFLRGFYLDNKMVLFLCGVCNEGHMEAHHIGMDYGLNRSHQLYLNMLYAFIEEGISRKADYISFGRTALEIKSTIGAEPVYFNAWIKMGNTVLNKLMKPFLPDKPGDDWVQRNPFRKNNSPID